MANFRARGKAATPSPLVRQRPARNSSFVAFAAKDDGFCAYVHSDVLERIEAHAQQGNSNEVMGLLAGRICLDLQSVPYTLVMAAEGAFGDEVTSGPDSVHISPEGRANVSQRLRDSNPDREIVGWYHTHPHGTAFFSQTDTREQAGWTDPNHIGIVFAPRAAEDSLGVYRGPGAVRLTRFPWPQPARVTRNFVKKDSASKALHQSRLREHESAASVTTEPVANARALPAVSATTQTAEAAVSRRAREPYVSRIVVLLAVLAALITLVWMHTRISAVELAQRTSKGAGGNTASSAAPPLAAASTSPTTPTVNITPAQTPTGEHSVSHSETGAAILPPGADGPAVSVPANPIRPERDNAAPRTGRDDSGAGRDKNPHDVKKAAEEAKARHAQKKAAKATAKAAAKANGTTNSNSTGETQRRPQGASAAPTASPRQRVVSPTPTP